MSKLVRAGLTAGVAIILAVGTTAPAQARDGDETGGDNTGGGYEVSVQVVFSGDGAPDGGGGYTISVPAQCWWEQFSYDGWEMGGDSVIGADGTDAEQMLEWRDEYVASLGSSSVSAGNYYQLPDREWFEAQVAIEDGGGDVNFYTPTCVGGWDQLLETEYTEVIDRSMVGPIPIMINAWEVNVSTPEPYVDPEDLAIEAREVLEIPAPEIDRNPKITNGPAGATFVNLPTWFWVTDPQSVGGEEGELRIRAEIVGSPVWAEVTATTGGLSLASAAGSRECAPSLAVQAWQPGIDPAAGCTVSFSRSSVGYPDGYPVTASTFWNASWEGIDQDGSEVGGDLDALEQSVSVNVPVAEVQSVVQGDG